MDSNLFAIRDYHVNKTNTGIIITLSAQGGGKKTYIKCYVPFKSIYPNSPTASVIKKVNDFNSKTARVEIPIEHIFENH